jgi:hypothetical protein
VCHLLTGGARLAASLPALAPAAAPAHPPPPRPSAGPCCFLRCAAPAGSAGAAAFSSAFEQCAGGNRAGVVRGAAELLLAPVRAAAEGAAESATAEGGGTHIELFAVFAASINAADFLVKKVLAPRRLPVIFDLDETLLAAKAGGWLSREAAVAAAASRAAPADAAAAADAALLAADAAALEEFARRDAVGEARARWLAPGAPGGAPRPLLELPSGALLTRPDPAQAWTSMAFRLRPGWPAARAFLAGALDARGEALARPAPPIAAFVCTTAEREYAHEAWRALDPSAEAPLIAPAARRRRIVCVDGKAARGGPCKSVLDALGLAPAARPPAALGGPPRSAMPLAVVVDDRDDVWEEDARAQLLQVKAFSYLDAAREAAGRAPAEGGALARVRAALLEVRSAVFKAVDRLRAPATFGADGVLAAALDLAAPAASYARALPAALLAAEALPAARARAEAAAAAAAAAAPPFVPRPLPPHLAAPLPHPAPQAQPQPFQPPQDPRQPARDPRPQAPTAAAPAQQPQRPQQPQQQQRPAAAPAAPQDWTQMFRAGLTAAPPRALAAAARPAAPPARPAAPPARPAAGAAAGAKRAREPAPAGALAADDPVVLLSRRAQQQGWDLKYALTEGGGMWHAHALREGMPAGAGTGGAPAEARRRAAADALAPAARGVARAPPPAPAPAPARAENGVARIGALTALRELKRHFARETPSFSDLAEGPPVRVRLAVDDCSAEGEGETAREARQHAALRVLAQLNYSVDFGAWPR